MTAFAGANYIYVGPLLFTRASTYLGIRLQHLGYRLISVLFSFLSSGPTGVCKSGSTRRRLVSDYLRTCPMPHCPTVPPTRLRADEKVPLICMMLNSCIETRTPWWSEHYSDFRRSRHSVFTQLDARTQFISIRIVFQDMPTRR